MSSSRERERDACDVNRYHAEIASDHAYDYLDGASRTYGAPLVSKIMHPEDQVKSESRGAVHVNACHGLMRRVLHVFLLHVFSRRMLSTDRRSIRRGQRRQSLRRATVFHTNKEMSEEEGKRKASFSLPKALCFFIDTKENNVHTGFFAVSLLRSSSVCAYITGRAWLWSVLLVLLKELLLFSQLPSRRGLTTVTVVDYALPCGLSEATTRLGTNEEV